MYVFNKSGTMMNKVQQKGLSIIELLIALAISSFIILGVTQLFISNKRNYSFQQAQAENQSNSRFSTLILDEFLNKAGYRRSVHQLVEDAFPATTSNDYCAAFDEGHVVTKLKNNDETGFCIRYQPVFSGELDCQGDELVLSKNMPFAPVPPSEAVQLAFKYNSTTRALECANAQVSASYMPLVEGVVDMNFVFAVGNKDALDKRVTGLIMASDWKPGLSGVIRGINYSLLLASTNTQRDGESIALENWNKQFATSNAVVRVKDEQLIYQTIHSNKLIRNLML